jgi:hypothetical protein
MMKRAASAIRTAVVLIALSPFASAQTPTTDATGAAAANGTVIGPGNKPQAGVPVQIVGPPGQTVAITDKDGKWSVYNLPAGDYKVKMVGADNSANAKQVTFSVKEKSLFNKLIGNATEIVTSPAIHVDAGQ